MFTMAGKPRATHTLWSKRQSLLTSFFEAHMVHPTVEYYNCQNCDPWSRDLDTRLLSLTFSEMKLACLGVFGMFGVFSANVYGDLF